MMTVITTCEWSIVKCINDGGIRTTRTAEGGEFALDLGGFGGRAADAGTGETILM